MNTATLAARIRKRVMRVIEQVATEEGVAVAAILNGGRSRRLTLIRHRAMWRAKVETGRPSSVLGRIFRRDPSTVRFGICQYQKRLEQQAGQIAAWDQ